jgi:hypothetical protein
MIRFFQKLAKRHQANNTMKRVMILEKSGNAEEALKLCQGVVNEFPRDSLFRFILANLQESLGRKITLPDNSKNNPKTMQ